MNDRYCYGANCTWHGPIQSTEKRFDTKLPCCPMCGGMLFETEKDKFFDGAIEHDKSGHNNYYEFIKWTENKCYPNIAVAYNYYKKITGRTVIL